MIDLSVDLKDQKWEKLPTNKIGKIRQLNTFLNNLHHFCNGRINHSFVIRKEWFNFGSLINKLWQYA